MLLDGDARSRPRSATTVYVYFTAVQPLIGRWSADHGHLREVTAEDIRAGLDKLRGHPLHTTISAVRSLFRFAKKRGLIFANPARRLKADVPESGLLPMTDDEIRAVEEAISHPGQRLIVAMAAVHRRTLGSDPQPYPGRPGPAQPARYHRRAPPATRRPQSPGAAGLA